MGAIKRGGGRGEGGRDVKNPLKYGIAFAAPNIALGPQFMTLSRLFMSPNMP